MLRTIHSCAVMSSNGSTRLCRRWSHTTASPMRMRDGRDSGEKRSTSSGVVKGWLAPLAKMATAERRHSSSSGRPISSHSAAMCRSLMNRWW